MNPHRTGRPTTDPKQQTIKLRLNDEMRSFIEHAADAAGVSMSEYIRWMIGDAMFAYNLKEDIAAIEASKNFPKNQKGPHRKDPHLCQLSSTS